MIRRLFILLAALSTLSPLSGCVINVQRVEPGTKAKDGSVYLGFDLVSSKKRDKDFTTVKKELGKFSKFRLHVSKAPANIKRLTLHFGNGDKFNVRLKPRFGKNDWSRWVFLVANAASRKSLSSHHAPRRAAGRSSSTTLVNRIIEVCRTA